nr:thymidylate synthase [uncultured Lachnoclostridium sp.]
MDRMKNNLSFLGVNEAYLYLINMLQKAPESKPRGMKVKECLGVAFTITNPRDRVVKNSLRKISSSFAVGEFLWYLRGSNQLDIMKYYSSMYPKFSDDQVTVHGAYGPRIFGGKTSQWESIKKKLNEDSDSRQAVITIYQPMDLFTSSRDIPCTCNLQYFIRDGKLHAITYMRSNDIYLGMPYDIFSFTLFQEMLALEMGVELGSYTHMVGSMHIYENNFSIFEQLQNEFSCDSYTMMSMPKEAIEKEQIELLLQVESILRNNGDILTESKLQSYWDPFVEVLIEKKRRIYQ